MKPHHSEHNLQRDYAYYKSAIANQSLPCALLDLDAFDKNLDAIISLISDAGCQRPIRLATKSLRSVPLLKRVLAHNSIFQGLMCFHPREACELADLGFDNLLVAYPCLQESVIRSVCQRLAAKPSLQIYLMVDSIEHLQQCHRIAREENVVLPVCMDIDLSLELPGLRFGVYRSPVDTLEKALHLFELITGMPYLRLAGVMGYEAQIAGAMDHYPGRLIQNLVIPWLKKISVPRLRHRRQSIVHALQSAGAQLDFVNGGGTGSLATTLQDQSVTELTLGSALFSPALFDHYADFQYQPSLFFALEVVRKPDKDHVTCAGGGYVASGSSGIDKLPVPWLPGQLALEPNEGAGEVQTPLRLLHPARVSSPNTGDPVFFRHAKAGELCEHFNHLILISDGVATGTARTYRGEGWQFL